MPSRHEALPASDGRTAGLSTRYLFAAVAVLAALLACGCKRSGSAPGKEQAGVDKIAPGGGRGAMKLCEQDKKPGCFVYVAPGKFTMGSPPDEPGRNKDEFQHEVTLTRGFYLQAHEVTQGEWQALMGNNPSHFKSCGATCPVDNVSWWGALALANARSDSEGLERCYTLTGCDEKKPGEGMKCAGVEVNDGGAPGDNVYLCKGYRLPTEAEWEYAYRAGTTTTFYSGDLTEIECGADPALDKIGWYCGNSGKKSHEVGTRAPNPWGLYDMAGNVWEWLWNWYGVHPKEAVTDPLGPETGPTRLFRDGSWFDNAQYSRAASRSARPPEYRSLWNGLRLARTRPPG